jgi:hypothetical protein
MNTTDEMNRVEWLKARLRVLNAALAFRAPPITARDFQVTRPTSLTVSFTKEFRECELQF